MRSATSLINARARQEPVWPLAVIVLGLSLTLSWTAFLAYGLVRIVDFMI
jgi:hypothetical protein